MTPDCTGNVIKIQIFDSDGLKTEVKNCMLCRKKNYVFSISSLSKDQFSNFP